MAEPLIGPQPIIGAGDAPDVVGGDAPTTEYAPINEAADKATASSSTPTKSSQQSAPS